MNEKKRRIVLIGPGRVGQTVGKLLQEAEYDIRAVIGVDEASAKKGAWFIGAPQAATTDLARARDGEVVLLAVPDDDIGEVAARLRSDNLLAPGAVLVHFSGLHPSAILKGEGGAPLYALCLHPVQTFANPVMGVQNLPGSPISIEGADDLLPLAEELVGALGGIPFRLATKHKPLYHAAACILSNYLVTLAGAARDLLTACDFSPDEAFRLFAPLLRGTVQNLTAGGPEQALTGPIARGDRRTVAKHLRALSDQPEQIGELYRCLGKATVEMALRAGTLDEQGAARIKELLDEDQPSS